MEITLKLSVDKVQVLLNLLGQVPTNLGLFPLFVEIQQQAEAQVQAANAAAVPAADAEPTPDGKAKKGKKA